VAKGPAKSAAKTPAKAAAADAKDAAKPTAPAASGKASAEKPAEEKAAVRRDPFDTLLTKARAGNAPPENLPPGKAGLIVDTLRINGIVHSPNGMIAVVSNAQQRVYFLREGDKLYDGSVQKIALDAISFNEIGKDAFGKPLERVVTKRLYPTSGEQQ
jgi:Tfp pilus assembly protein PilP